MSNWEIVKINDIGKVVTGKTPRTDDSQNYGSDFMFLGPTDLHKHFIITKSEKMISSKGFASIKGSKLDGLSILVGCIGWDMGNVALVNCKCATNQQINSITEIKESYNPLYIYYWLKHKKNYLFKIANVTRTPILNKSDFSNIELSVPNKIEQDKITKVLSDLDAKIELNNKINDNLELMAKTLYDYWFVQFDFPDANRKPYKTSGGKMVWNEELKREIPEGWEVVDLDKVENNIVTGKTPSTTVSENFNGEIPFICIGDVRGNMHIVNSQITLSKQGAESQINKFIPEGSICVTCIASPGLVGFATRDSQTNQQLNSIVCENFENRYYLYFYLTDYFKYSSAKTGNTFANMNKGDFSAIQVIKPKKEILISFSNVLKSSIDKILNNSLENKELASLRDWLLPMLMNGQVSVGEFEEELRMVAEERAEYKSPQK